MYPTMRLQYLALAILFLTALWWSASDRLPAAVGQETKRYVYKVVDVPPDHAAMQTTLNEYGSAGWELILIGMGDMTTPRLVFKK
jgi:hypothetical protein